MPRDSAGHLIPGRVGSSRRVPDRIPRPEYVGRPGPRPYTGDDRYSPDEIERIRGAGRLAAQAVEAVAAALRPGITTDELDAIGHEFLVAHDAYPSALGYRGFPKSICTSVNEAICHGIPDDTVLLDGDIVKIDITAFADGMHGDLCATFPVGDVTPEAADLVERTREALTRGIRSVAPGRELNVIGRTIESYARRFGYGVVRDYTGHGVGEAFHSGLVVPHYDAAPDHATLLEPGMVFTIEPMLTIGTPEEPGTVDWDEWDDGWTVVTRDRSLTAQFEHTIVVTERGSEILTLP
ncbi:type I methionyl aminopeptidase [Pseudolysinimonas sp.]|jgi:methionyl aminopeptidase|uniref:type I methionyl aminopeptidase n=1 Tax=Pseudolysinimonas sp. TaxID=2680009 RepID=UPI0037843A40